MTIQPTSLFVYGTLQPGEERWPLLVPYVHGEGRPATVRGRLYDTGEGYPAALFDDSADSIVVGTIFTMLDQSLAAALESLDEVEGAVDGLYRRLVVETTDGRRAWAYEYGAGLRLVPISSGDWLRRG